MAARTAAGLLMAKEARRHTVNAARDYATANKNLGQHDHSELQSAVVTVLAAIVDDEFEAAVDLEHGGVKRANSAASDASEDVLEAIGEELEAAVAMLQKNYRANKLPVLVSCCFLLWLFMMVFFYRYGVNLTWAQSMFFTVDTGMSVGYGSVGIECETPDGPFPTAVCEWVTAIHMLFVALLFTVLLGALASVVVIGNADNLKEKMKKQGKVVGKEKLDAKMAKAGVGDDKLAKRLAATRKRAEKPSLIKNPVIKWGFLWFVWLGVGVAYGMLIEEFWFSKSILFSVSAMSTAGLIAPSTGDWAMVLCTFYTLIGTIVFATFIGYIGDTVLQRIQRSVLKRRAGLSSQDQDRLKESMIQGKTKVDYASFFEFTLLAKDFVTDDDLKDIRAEWDTINCDGNEYISLDELYCAQLFDMADEDGSGKLELDEMVALGELIDKRMADDMGLEELEDQVQARLQKYIQHKAVQRASVKRQKSDKKANSSSVKNKKNGKDAAEEVFASFENADTEDDAQANVAKLKSTDAVMNKREFVQFFVTTLHEILDKAGDGKVDANMRGLVANANKATKTNFMALNTADGTGSESEDAFGFAGGAGAYTDSD